MPKFKEEEKVRTGKPLCYRKHKNCGSPRKKDPSVKTCGTIAHHRTR
jgi:hypothetical protein